MRVFRRVILPISYLVVLLLIAVSLAWLAFRPQPQETVAGSATGEVLAEQTEVMRGDVTNTLTFDGKIEVEPAKEAKARAAGTLVHIFEQPGRKVKKGARLFQVKAEAEDTGSDGAVPQSGDSADGSTGADSPGSRSESGPGSRSGNGTGGATGGAVAAPAPPRARYINAVAPADGVVGDYVVEKGEDVSKGQAVTSIEQDSFRARATIQPAQLYRIPTMPDTATVTITDGPQPFDCSDLRVSQVSGSRSGAGGSAGGSGSDGSDSGGGDSGGGEDIGDGSGDGSGGGSGGGSGPSISCAIPSEVTVYNGLSMKLAINAGSATDVLLVPTTAVRGTIGEGSVWVIDDGGEPVETKVKLGLNDGKHVEIVEGLTEGQSIASYVPGRAPQSDEVIGEEFESGTENL